MNNIVLSNGCYNIYSDSIEVYKQIPKGVYKVCFDMNKGFFLTKHNELQIKEPKIYGKTESKVNKVLETFKLFDRNLGIILSGPKGSGKTLFTKVLSEKSEMPILLIDSNINGLGDFISEIDQEIIIIFDEFDKHFTNSNSEENTRSQEHLLSLFDGTDNGKKIFILTCNEIAMINKYFLNRPGRIHYHFEFSNPSIPEIEEYLKDNLKPNLHDYINEIIELSVFGNISYDILRAICFELNNGRTLEESLEDLNIYRENIHFEANYVLKDNETGTTTNNSIDFIYDSREFINIREDKKVELNGVIKRIDYFFRIPIEDFKLDINSQMLVYSGEKPIYCSHCSDYYYEDDLSEEQVDKIKKLYSIEQITAKRTSNFRGTNRYFL